MDTNLLILIISISITAFFAGIIIWMNARIFRKQREFDIRRHDYKEATEKLANIDRWLASIWGVRDAEGLKLHKTYIDKQIKSYEDNGGNVTDIHAGLQYFPEIHILAICINNDFLRRLDTVTNINSNYKDKKNDLERHGNVGLLIMNELSRIRRDLAYDILHYKIEESDFKKEYIKKINTVLSKHPDRKDYKDTWSERSWFNHFNSVMGENI